jgi:hypothetical protein
VRHRRGGQQRAAGGGPAGRLRPAQLRPRQRGRRRRRPPARQSPPSPAPPHDYPARSGPAEPCGSLGPNRLSSLRHAPGACPRPRSTRTLRELGRGDTGTRSAEDGAPRLARAGPRTHKSAPGPSHGKSQPPRPREGPARRRSLTGERGARRGPGAPARRISNGTRDVAEGSAWSDSVLGRPGRRSLFSTAVDSAPRGAISFNLPQRARPPPPPPPSPHTRTHSIRFPTPQTSITSHRTRTALRPPLVAAAVGVRPTSAPHRHGIRTGSNDMPCLE